eukprot:4471818-Prymnesium_polylepis.1
MRLAPFFPLLAVCLVTTVAADEVCPARCADNHGPFPVEESAPARAWPPLPLEADLLPPLPERIGEDTFLVHGLLTEAESAAIIAVAEGTHAFEPEHIYF